jgi:RNA polymerase sigma-70 factor (ECF subfamily)
MQVNDACGSTISREKAMTAGQDRPVIGAMTTTGTHLRLVRADELPTATERSYVRGMAGPGLDRVSSTIESVIARFRTMVRSVGARRGLVEADLDEVLQDVRIRLWQAGEGGKALEELGSSYLYHVATTAALDLLRRRRARRADDTEDIRERTDLTTDRASPHDALEARELASQIEAAVETLAIDRRVAVRFHLAGYDREDIARMLGWTPARTRNLLYRGLDDLRRRLTDMGISPRRTG